MFNWYDIVKSGWGDASNPLSTGFNLASPDTTVTGNKVLSPDTTLMGKFMSPDTSIMGNKLLSPDTNISGRILSPDTNITSDQMGVFNLKGTIDASTKKMAVINMPSNIQGSPNASTSSSARVSGDAPTSSLFGGLNVGGDALTLPLLLGGGALLLFAVMSKD